MLFLPWLRKGAPERTAPGSSTLRISAPRAASSHVHSVPGYMWLRSSTLTPCRIVLDMAPPNVVRLRHLAWLPDQVRDDDPGVWDDTNGPRVGEDKRNPRRPASRKVSALTPLRIPGLTRNTGAPLRHPGPGSSPGPGSRVGGAEEDRPTGSATSPGSRLKAGMTIRGSRMTVRGSRMTVRGSRMTVRGSGEDSSGVRDDDPRSPGRQSGLRDNGFGAPARRVRSV